MNRRDFIKKSIQVSLIAMLPSFILKQKEELKSYGGWYTYDGKKWNFTEIKSPTYPSELLDGRMMSFEFKGKALSDEEIETIYQQTRLFFEV